MVLRIVATAAAILAVMVAIKDGRVLRDTGLTGSCSVVQTQSDGTQIESCIPGKLAGAPDLSRDSCTAAGSSGQVEYWHCPASVVSSEAGR